MFSNVLFVAVLVIYTAAALEYKVTDYQGSFLPTAIGQPRGSLLVPSPAPYPAAIDGWNYTYWDFSNKLQGADLPYEGSYCGFTPGIYSFSTTCGVSATGARYVAPNVIRPGLLQTNSMAASYSFQQNFPTARIAGSFQRVYNGIGDGVKVGIYYRQYTASNDGPYSLIWPTSTSPLTLSATNMALQSYNFVLSNVKNGDRIAVVVNNGGIQNLGDDVYTDFSIYSDCSTPCDCYHCLVPQSQTCPATPVPLTAPPTPEPGHNTDSCIQSDNICTDLASQCYTVGFYCQFGNSVACNMVPLCNNMLNNCTTYVNNCDNISC